MSVSREHLSPLVVCVLRLCGLTPPAPILMFSAPLKEGCPRKDVPKRQSMKMAISVSVVGPNDDYYPLTYSSCKE